MDLYKKIMADKGKTGSKIFNLPMSELLMNEDDEKNAKYIHSGVIAFNLLATGHVDKSLRVGGQLLLSSPSKHGKSLQVLAHILNAQQSGEIDKIIVFNTEGPTGFSYTLARQFGVDMDKTKVFVFEDCIIESIMNTLAKNCEDLTIEQRRRIFVVIDSWGGLTTLNLEDKAVAGSITKDFQETQLKNRLALFLNNMRVTRLLIAHCYDNVGGFGDPLKIGGGTKFYYLSDSAVLFASRKKQKDSSDEISGWIITGKTHKSRYHIEGTTQLEVLIETKGCLNQFFGLLPDALEGGFVLKEQGKITRAHIENDPPVKELNIYTEDFWGPIFLDTDFQKYLEDKYQYSKDNITLATSNINKLFKNRSTGESNEIVSEDVPSETKGKRGRKSKTESTDPTE